uniref:Putative salivary scp/antigen 5 protein n=1 Tax=Panstrongylus lignarius TaxID=156445 RepID=A0A224XN08_9HEMI
MAKSHNAPVFSWLALALIGSLVACTQQACKNSNTLLGMKELTQQDKRKLLHAHNKFRDLTASGNGLGHQPPAQNMLVLGWNEYAAQQAYSWASGCEFMHNDPKDKKNRPMGQNLYVKMSSEKENVNTTFSKYVDSMVEGWYNETKLYTFGSGFSGLTGHYTQLVWATTAKLGCGYSYYKENNWHVGYLVCNYSPAGNMYGEDPYVTGSPNCSSFDLTPVKKYKHLCIKKPTKKNIQQT